MRFTEQERRYEDLLLFVLRPALPFQCGSYTCADGNTDSNTNRDVTQSSAQGCS
jgi:hypothetical protein